MSMSPINVLVMALVPIAIGAALLIAALSGRLSTRTRARVQFALGAVAYPVSVIFLAWQAVSAFADSDVFRTLIYAGGAAVMALGGVRLLRRRVAGQGREAA